MVIFNSKQRLIIEKNLNIIGIDINDYAISVAKES